MSRKARAKVEYFSHNCKHGRVVFIMQSEWGNDGYAAFFKLYELLGDSEGHYIDCTIEGEWDYITSYINVPSDLAHEMVRKLCSIGVIDRDLWYNSMVLWSQSFVDDLDELYSKRTIDKPTKPDFSHRKPLSTGFPTPETPVNGIPDAGKPQSRVEYSKEKLKDLKKADELPPESESGKPPAPTGEGEALPSLKNVFELQDHAVKAHLNTLCDRLYKSGAFPQADAFKNTMLKKGKNPRAILHALVRCSIHARDDPWGYCTKIIRTENGNYNERGFIQEAAAHNVSREEAREVLEALGFAL